MNNIFHYDINIEPKKTRTQIQTNNEITTEIQSKEDMEHRDYGSYKFLRQK